MTMTANRFDEIKKATKDYEMSHVTALDLAGLGDIFAMLTECVAELERISAVPVVGGRDHVKRVIFDGQGNAIAPPPIAVQLATERREQYAIDRHEVLMALDIKAWRVFSLRWGLAPPPGGWDSEEQIMNVMHAVRLSVASIPYIEKHKSAVHLHAKGIALPRGVRFENGALRGVELPPE